MALEAGASSAIGGAFSLADIVATLYSSFINYSENLKTQIVIDLY